MDNSLKNGGALLSATALRDSLNQKLDTSSESTMLTLYQKDLLLQGEREIDESLDEVDEVAPFKYPITSSWSYCPVYDLVMRISTGDIIIPQFQRGYVWSHKEASLFVESLLLGLPVPSIFLSKEPETQKLLVIDGQQRLLTLRHYYDGIWPSTRKEFALKGVPSRFEGSTYKNLARDDQQRLGDALVHAVVVQQDGPSDDSSSIYHIFERLNTSGVSLTPQEIRTAIHHGEFADLLRDLNATEDWRAVYGPVNKFMRDQELVLRFLALYYDAERYGRPMKGFLNDFMGHNKHLTRISGADMQSAFVPTIEVIRKSIGKRSFRLARALNAAVFDAVMFGVARRLRRGAISDLDTLRLRYTSLLDSPSFLAAAERATADEESVSKRLELAVTAFAEIP